MPGKLNSFQRTMLQWNDLHPYNAVHVVRIPGAFDPEHLRSVLRDTLAARGLSGLTLDCTHGTFQYHGGSALSEIKLLAGGDDPRRALATEIEHQLNRGFLVAERFDPFRFFVLPEAGSFSLGLVYFHAIADAESIALLLKKMTEAYRGHASPESSQPVELYPPRYDHLLRQQPGALVRKLCALPALVRELRRSCRPRYRDPQDLHNGFDLFSLKPAALVRLAEAGNSWGVTFNDVLLAVLLSCVAPLAFRRTRARRRRKISLGCIVNLRKDLGLDSARTFGLFLGSFVVTHEVPAGMRLKDLAVDIRRQTLAIKGRRLYLGTPLELAVARRFLPFYSTALRKKLYQKHYPLWGGITNMNLNALWEQPAGQEPVDYFRAVSTGPVTPLVLSVTTVGDVVNVGLSFRSTVFAAPEIERIKTDFVNALSQVSESAG